MAIDNITLFSDSMTLENAKMIAINSILSDINSYEVVEEEMPSGIKWKINFYDGEILMLDNKPTLIEYKIPDVFEIEFIKSSDNLWSIKKLPSLAEINNNFSIKYKSIMNQLERIVLKVSWINLLKIPQINNAVTPFFDIVKKISRVGRITFDEVESLEKKRRKSFDKYIKLLILNGIIEKGKDGYHLTNTSLKIISMSKSKNNEENGENKDYPASVIMSHFIYNAAPQLVHGMKLYSLNSYAYLENAYYIPTLQINAMKKFTLETYERMYKKINKRKPPTAYIYSLYRLEDAGLLEIVDDDTHILGIEDKYSAMHKELREFYANF